MPYGVLKSPGIIPISSGLGTSKLIHTHDFSKTIIPFLQLGEWSYTIQGQGLRPTVMNPVVVSCGLGEATQTLLHFKNPLDQAINVQCRLLDKNKVERNGRFSKLYFYTETI
eukprot:sb/3477090/